MFKRVALGSLTHSRLAAIEDVNARELLAIVALAIFVIWIGLYPSPFINLMHVSVEHLLQQVEGGVLLGGIPEGVLEGVHGGTAP
jgi:NADH-quinone oxidoreductase subunit M